MHWMFESRSKDYYSDDDPEGGTYQPSIKWYEFLLLPIVAVPFIFLYAIFEIFILLFIFSQDFYSTVKRVAESGKLEFPGLFFTGIAIAVILPIMISNHLFETVEHPTVIFCSSVFVLLFTLAPLTGLVLRHFKQK